MQQESHEKIKIASNSVYAYKSYDAAEDRRTYRHNDQTYSTPLLALEVKNTYVILLCILYNIYNQEMYNTCIDLLTYLLTGNIGAGTLSTVDRNTAKLS